jgi:uncharacterized membrane protein SpoIIM required for sporulation
MALISEIAEPAFVARRQAEWNELDALVRTARTRGLRGMAPARIVSFSPLYRDACADLARAQSARYSAALVDYLQALTAGAHAVLYGGPRRTEGWSAAAGGSRLRLALAIFPRAVRRHRVAMLVAFLLFFVPFFGGLLATLAVPDFALRIVPESLLRPLADAYRHGFASARGTGADAEMAGFYVSNNVGIALRCFATGLVFGLGSALYLVENGLATGAILGHVASHGGGSNILTFIVGHGSLELTAIVLAGGAGLAMGWSLVAPGDRTRLASLRATARSVVPIVFGATIMLFMAAAIEGFWSASPVPAPVKRLVGASMFVLVLLYILLAGRGSRAAKAFERAQAVPWT